MTSSSDAVDLDDVTNAVLSASRALVAVAARSLAAVGDTVSLPQFRALVVLAQRGRVTVSGLAEELGVHSSSATRLVDRLATADLVRREQSSSDRREVELVLTDLGRDVVSRVFEHRRRDISRIVSAVPEEQRRAIVAGLDSFSEAAGEVPAQAWSFGWGLGTGAASS
jgi:DNA-binding MarR family transcriptional regulator